jgi:hypothetical protein
MAKNEQPYRKPTHDEIAAFAQRIYEQEGRPQGKAMDHWLQAEAQLTADYKALAGQMPALAPAKPAVTAPTGKQTPGWQAPAKQPVLHRN